MAEIKKLDKPWVAILKGKPVPENPPPAEPTPASVPAPVSDKREKRRGIFFKNRFIYVVFFSVWFCFLQVTI